MLYEQIYTDLLQHGKRTHAPGPWGRFAKQADFWLLPEDTTTTLAALQKKHAIKHLIRSGVATWGTTLECSATPKPPVLKPLGNAPSSKEAPPSGSDTDDASGVVFDQSMSASYLAFLGKQQMPTEKKELVINPILCGPFNQIVPLRALPDSHPFDLLTGEGTARGQLPCCAVLHDCHFQKAVQRMKFLCLTLSLADMMAFRGVGIPAVVATGLEQLTPKTVSQFFANLGLASSGGCGHGNTGQSATASQEGPLHDEQASSPSGQTHDPMAAMHLTLFLVGWSPAQLSLHRPDTLDEVQRNLANIIQFLATDFDDVFVWRPTPSGMQRISFCLGTGTRKDVQGAIVASLRTNARRVAQSCDEQEQPRGLLEARSRLREVLLRPGISPRERRRRLRDHQEAVDREFVTPLLEQAAAEPNLKRRSGLAALAGANQVLHSAVELYLAKLEDQVAKRGLKAEGQDAEAKGLLKMFDVVGKLTEEGK